MSPADALGATNANTPNHGLCRLETTRHARPRGSVLGWTGAAIRTATDPDQTRQ